MTCGRVATRRPHAVGVVVAALVVSLVAATSALWPDPAGGGASGRPHPAQTGTGTTLLADEATSRSAAATTSGSAASAAALPATATTPDGAPSDGAPSGGASAGEAGADDGWEVGATDGAASDGAPSDGVLAAVGASDGGSDGEPEGAASDGAPDGASDGATSGDAVPGGTASDGAPDGASDGATSGDAVPGGTASDGEAATAGAPSDSATSDGGAAVRVPSRGVALVDQTDWLADGEPFDLRLAVGEGVGAQDSIAIDLYAAVTSRSQFTATLDGRLLGTRRAQVTIPLGELPEQADGSRRVRLVPEPTDVPGERSVGRLGRPGVYPLVVGVRPAGTGAEPAAPVTTYVVRTPADRTTLLQVAVVQPVAAPLAHQPDGSVALGEGALDELATLADVLASSAGTPLTVAPRPETLEAVRRVAGDATGAEAVQATAVLDDLRTAVADRQVVSGPYVDVALDALEAAGLGEDVAAQRRRGDAVLDEVLGARTDARTWLADGGLDGRSLRRLAGLGVDRVLLPDDVLSPVELRLSLARPFRITTEQPGSRLVASAPEPALSVRYGSDDPVLAAQHVLADLAVLHGDEPVSLRPRGVVLAPPADATTTDPAFLSAVLAGLATSPVLAPVTLETYFGEVDVQTLEDGPLVRTVSPGGEQLGISEAEVWAARSRLTGFGTMVTGQAEALEALADLTLLAEADGLDVARRRSYLAGVGSGIDARLGSVGVVDAASFRLADSVGTIPLTLVRDGDDRLLVRVTLESEQLAFGPERQVGRYAYDVELTSENTPLVVPVLVRSPGTFPLLVTISSPDGRLEVARTQVTIHSTAFSGVGVALSAGAGFFLLLWWGRHWRTVRRAKRLVPVP